MSGQKRIIPPELAARIKREYPEFQVLHLAVDRNALDSVGRALQDSIGGLDAARVLALLDMGQVERIKELAEGVVRRAELYEAYSNWYFGNPVDMDAHMARDPDPSNC